VELLGPLATTAFQTIYPYRNRLKKDEQPRPTHPAKRPRLLETCYAFATDSPVVKRYWPDFYTGK
jgi:hypothetical protein